MARSEEVVRSGEYELFVKILHRGTRSEGRVGRLYRNGVEVVGAPVGTEVVAGGVTFRYCGEDRPHLWSASGWAVVTE